MVEIASYGTWESPVTALEAARAGGGPQWVWLHGGAVWWACSLPSEGGRLELLRDGAPVLGAPWNVRNRLHEYGGRPYAVVDVPGGVRVAFTNWEDQRIYLLDPDGGGAPVPITVEPSVRHGLRYGDLVAGPDGGSVWCVRESVTGPAPTDVVREIVSVPLDGGEPVVLAASHRFMAGVRPSPDGAHLAWIGWDHPDMPWDSSELCVAGVGGGHRVVAGGAGESVCQVEWDGSAALLALTDPDGWWNLHRIGFDGSRENLAACERELGGALWKPGQTWFAPVGDGYRYAVLASGSLAVLDERGRSVTPVEVGLPVWQAGIVVSGGVVAGVAGGPLVESSVVTLDLSTGVVEHRSEAAAPHARYLPEPELRVFSRPDGQRVPAWVYLPFNPDFAAPEGELPPFVVHVHGGPTGRFAPALDLDFAFLTSRGIGVVAVDYGGSTGYGRAYRERLRGQWGVVDVEDCAAVAEALAAEGTADGARLAIRGGSAGGWTSAASLTSVSTYRCGMVAFPILDLAGWTAEGGETHDFESRYVEGLVGRLPEAAQLYRDRSPSGRADRLAGPVLMLQGLEDEICPPAQAERFMAGLAGSGVPHAYLAFEGEQHGFRREATMVAALEAELSFYGQVLGFVPAGVPVLGLSS